MQPKVEQLDEQTFLVTVREDELPFTADDLDDHGMREPRSISGKRWWFEWKERQMIAEAKSAILRGTHIGEMLRSWPKYSSRKSGISIVTHERYDRFGFRVRIRDKRHVIMFKLAMP